MLAMNPLGIGGTGLALNSQRKINKRRAGGMQSSNWKWHLDEVFVKINGERHYLWRAVDHEGEVLESYVTKKRDKKAALKFMKKAMRRYGSPNEIVTDKLRSYSAAAKELGCSDKQVTERWANNRVENSHLTVSTTRKGNASV